MTCLAGTSTFSLDFGFERLQVGLSGRLSGCELERTSSAGQRRSAVGSCLVSRLVFSGCVPLEPSR